MHFLRMSLIRLLAGKMVVAINVRTVPISFLSHD